MLLTERQVRQIFSHLLDSSVKMPRKGVTVYLSSPYIPVGIGIHWTDRKSTEGKRLFNCGDVRTDGTLPPLFSM